MKESEVQHVLEKFKNEYPLLYRKIDILCNGIADDKLGVLNKIYSIQNPLDERRTGNAGLQIVLKELDLPLSVGVHFGGNSTISKISPYHLEENNGKLYIANSKDNFKTEILLRWKTPKWYKDDLGDGTKNDGTFVQYEGDFTAIASISTGCVYFDMGKPCAFCAIGKEGKTSQEENEIRKKHLAQTLKLVAKDKKIKNINLTGGNTFAPDRGAYQYLPYIKAIRSVNKSVPIAIEMTPPESPVTKEVMENLKKAGATGIVINIEFWNDEIRAKLMPIKGLFTKEEYFKAYKDAVSVFGKNKVICGIIVGVEPLSETYNAIKEIAKIGVIPETYPFKPNDGSLMANYPKTPLETVITASLLANSYIQKYGFDVKQSEGCIKCGACGLTQQLSDIKFDTSKIEKGL